MEPKCRSVSSTYSNPVQHSSKEDIVPTTCSYCSLQCGIHLHISPETGATRVTPRRDFPVTNGLICGKGYVCHEELHLSERLTSVLLRENGRLQTASWDRALAVIVQRVRDIQSRYGRDSLAVYSGGCLTNEKSYLIGKWARLALGTRHVDYNGRYCMSSAATAQNRSFGMDRGLPFPLSDIAMAQCILLCGSNLGETHPPMMQYLHQARRSGARVVAIDPRHTSTTKLADLHLRIRPGTDLALMNGLLHIAIRDGYLDHEFIAKRTTGFEAVKDTVQPYTPTYVAQLTDLAVEEIEMVARWFGEAEKAMILTARGIEQHSKGVDTVHAHINLALACGQIGRIGTGFGTITGQANGQGGREHGLKSDQLPGYRSIENPDHRRHIAAVWGVDEAAIPGRGLSAFEILDAAAKGEIRALFVLGSNPLVSAPHLNKVKAALSNLELLVVIDFFMSETAECADVVLPGNMWAEETGTVTNLEGRVLLRKKVTQPPNGVRSDVEILIELAKQLGAGQYFAYQSEADVFEELRQATKGGGADYAGITHQRLERDQSIFWPCPDMYHPGTPRPFSERFFHLDGCARFYPVTYRPPDEEPDHEYPYYLTTGRVSKQYQSGNQTRRLRSLDKLCSKPFAEMHPDLAYSIGLREGHPVRVFSRRGDIVVTTKLNSGMRTDTVFIPFHWGGTKAVNLLVNPALDALSKMPEFKVCAIRLEPYNG